MALNQMPAQYVPKMVFRNWLKINDNWTLPILNIASKQELFDGDI